jgi:hypothetical protein
MNLTTKVVGVVALAVTGLTVSTRAADATGEGYVCTSTYAPIASQFGNNGYIVSYYYTGQHCTGSFLEAPIYCSTGGTSSYCSGVFYDEQQILALSQNLQRAASSQQHIYSQTGSSTTQGLYVQFRGD